MAKIADGAIFIIGENLNEHRGATRSVPLVRQFELLLAFNLSRSTLYRPIDVVVGHINCFRLIDREPQSGIAVRISPTLSRRNGYLMNASGKDFTALLIRCAFFALYFAPFGMA
jgi:hypothetical protein